MSVTDNNLNLDILILNSLYTIQNNVLVKVLIKYYLTANEPFSLNPQTSHQNVSNQDR